ncbi:MAG TPA: hypothetical protein VM619_14615 [Luteimonas sp.]|nr:hypothetical protein [Luteimonas sp.]
MQVEQTETITTHVGLAMELARIEERLRTDGVSQAERAIIRRAADCLATGLFPPPHSSVWIVGRWPETGVWQFQGVFATEAGAIEACEDGRYFIGPAQLGARIPAAISEWPGAYFPGSPSDRDTQAAAPGEQP